MTLLAIFLTLLFNHFGDRYKDLRALHDYDNAITRLHQRHDGAWLHGVFGVLVLVGVPMFGLALLLSMLGGLLFGLVGVALSVAVLYLCLGPLAVLRELDAYLLAHRAGDHESLNDSARRLLGEQPPVAADERDRLVLRAVLHAAGEQIAAVLFCFVLLGPVGALCWRLALQLAGRGHSGAEPSGWRAGLARAAGELLGILGWLPARLLALAFALAGGFERSVAELRRGVGQISGDLRQSNRALLEGVGLAALDLDPQDAHGSVGAGDLDSAARLLRRSLWLCLGLIGLLTLIGWVA